MWRCGAIFYESSAKYLSNGSYCCKRKKTQDILAFLAEGCLGFEFEPVFYSLKRLYAREDIQELATEALDILRFPMRDSRNILDVQQIAQSISQILAGLGN